MSRGLTGIIYGLQGMGKTSIGLRFPGTVRCFSIKESGYEDLAMVPGMVPENTLNIKIRSYEQLLTETKKVTSGTILLDSARGIQAIIGDYCTIKYFRGDYEQYHSFSKGVRQFAPVIFQEYLDLCNDLADKGVHIILLGHVGVVSITNPMGADYLQYVLSLDDGDKATGLRNVAISWAGFVFLLSQELTMTRKTEVEKSSNLILEGKVEGTDNRVIYTSNSLNHQSKNRWGLPQKISMGKDANEAFSNIWKLVPEGYKKGVRPSAS